MKRSGMIRQPIRKGIRQPHTTISSGGTSALKSTPRSATKMTATCWLPDCQLTYSSHRHEQHADNDNRPVLAESQQNFSWRGMVRSLASLLKFFGFLERIAQYEKKRNDQAANQEWNAPTPHHHILRWNQRAQKHAEERDEDDSNLLATRLPTDIKPLVAGSSDFGEVNRYTTQLDTSREALD